MIYSFEVTSLVTNAHWTGEKPEELIIPINTALEGFQPRLRIESESWMYFTNVVQLWATAMKMLYGVWEQNHKRDVLKSWFPWFCGGVP